MAGAMVNNNGFSGVDPSPPLLVFDDDQYMLLYESIPALVADTEWPFVDELVAVFDRHARPVMIWVRDESILVRLTSDEAELSRLKSSVNEFLRCWVVDPPFIEADDPSVYVSEVVQVYQGLRIARRKKRRPQ
jgi:hypothetical protein